MRFNKKRLRDAISKAIEEDGAAYRAETARDEKNQQDAADAWVYKYRNAWQEAASVIARKARDGEPIVLDDLPTSEPYRQSVNVFQARTTARRGWSAPKELIALAALLDTVEDDEVTSAGLQQLGFGQGTMRTVVNYLR